MTIADRDLLDDQIRAFLDIRSRDLGRVRGPASIANAVALRTGRRSAGSRLTRIAIPALVAGTVITALVVSGLSPKPPDVPPPPSATPTATSTATLRPTPTALPGHFTSVTPVGTIEWTRVTSARDIVAVASVDGQLVGFASDPASWFTSPDGLTWASIPAPEHDPALNFGAGGRLWTVDPGGGYSRRMASSARDVIARAWHETPEGPGIYERIGAGWAKVQLPTGIFRTRQGLHRVGSVLVHGVALDATTWIAPVTSYFAVPWRDIYQIPDSVREPVLYHRWEERFQVLQLWDIGEPGRRANLKVELKDTEPPTIEFRDETTKKLMYTMPVNQPGWTSEAMLRAVRGGWGAEEVDFVVGHRDPVLGDQSVLVQAPWARGELWEGGIVTALGKFFTISSPPGADFSLGGIHLWESTDGIAWSQVELPTLYSGTLDRAMLIGAHDTLVIGLDDGQARVWASTDGRTWAEGRIEGGGRPGGEPSAIDAGWMMPFSAHQIALSADGVAWHPTFLPPTDETPSVWFLNGRFFFNSEPRNGAFDTWVGTMVP